MRGVEVTSSEGSVLFSEENFRGPRFRTEKNGAKHRLVDFKLCGNLVEIRRSIIVSLLEASGYKVWTFGFRLLLFGPLVGKAWVE